MIASKNLLLSDPAKEKEWRQVLDSHAEKPVLYIICIPFDRSYAAEIMTAKEYYKQESSRRVIGIADHYSAAFTLFQSMIEDILDSDPKLDHLKMRLKEQYL